MRNDDGQSRRRCRHPPIDDWMVMMVVVVRGWETVPADRSTIGATSRRRFVRQNQLIPNFGHWKGDNRNNTDSARFWIGLVICVRDGLVWIPKSPLIRP